MPLMEAQDQTDMMSQLSSMPGGGDEALDPQGGIKGLGGPGIDTPQEQQAVQLLMQAMQSMRQAANVDPSIRPIVDKFLPDAFLQFSQHYGFGEEGKMALKQAQMMQQRARAGAISGQGAPTGPPTGAGPMMPGAGQQPAPSPQNTMIEY